MNTSPLSPLAGLALLIGIAAFFWCFALVSQIHLAMRQYLPAYCRDDHEASRVAVDYWVFRPEVPRRIQQMYVRQGVPFCITGACWAVLGFTSQPANTHALGFGILASLGAFGGIVFTVWNYWRLRRCDRERSRGQRAH
jgi:hypothetical protein